MHHKNPLAVTLLALFLAAPAIAASNAGKQGNMTTEPNAKRPRSVEFRLIAAVNKYRARFKLPPLKEDPILMRVAKKRAPFVDARHSAGSPGYNHRACGRWCREHARSAGFPGPATDNLAMGYETPERAVEGWANEDRDRDPAGHNYQMRGLAKVNGRWIDEGYNRIGVGIVGHNYIAIFGRSERTRR
jgi:uncharacterized protein YkwD